MRRSRGAVMVTTASNRSSPPASYNSGTSVTQTAGGSGRRLSSSRQARYTRETRGCRRPSSQASCAGSANTSRAISDRTISPSVPTIPGPKRSTRAERTSSSSRSRRWTISSLEIVAAPWRANARSAALLPAPMPPVIATASGRFTELRLVVLGRRLGRGRSGRHRCLVGGGVRGRLALLGGGCICRAVDRHRLRVLGFGGLGRLGLGRLGLGRLGLYRLDRCLGFGGLGRLDLGCLGLGGLGRLRLYRLDCCLRLGRLRLYRLDCCLGLGRLGLRRLGRLVLGEDLPGEPQLARGLLARA